MHRRRSAFVAVSALGLAAACLAGAAHATAAPALSGTARADPDIAGYAAEAGSQQTPPSIVSMEFTVPTVTCVKGHNSKVSVYAALNRIPAKPVGINPAAAIGIEISCIPEKATPSYVAFFQSDTESSQGRLYLKPRRSSDPHDGSFLVQPGQHLIASVRLMWDTQPKSHFSLATVSGGQDFETDGQISSVGRNTVECWVDHGPANDSVDSLAKFGTIKVSSCSAGPAQGTLYGKGYLAVPQSAGSSVTHQWGWTVIRSNMKSGGARAVTSRPLPATDPAAGSFVVVWKPLQAAP